MNSFCTEGVVTNPKCVSYQSFDFNSEEQIFDILLDVLKSQLPARIAELKGCDGKNLYISEDAIDLIPPARSTHLSLILDPLGDVPTYSENLAYRTVTYDFELTLTVVNSAPNCVTWELIRFKNAIEGLLIGAEFAIDGYNSVMLDPKGFTYDRVGPEGTNKYFREGQYRFSVTVTQYKNN